MFRLAPILIAAVISTVPLLGCERAAQPSPGPSSAPETENAATGTIVIVARVVDSPRPPPCGSSTFRVPVRYAVLAVEVGDFPETDILVRQDCPEGPRPAGDAGPIEEGDVHRLTLEAAPHITARRVQWLPVRTDAADDLP